MKSAARSVAGYLIAACWVAAVTLVDTAASSQRHHDRPSFSPGRPRYLRFLRHSAGRLDVDHRDPCLQLFFLPPIGTLTIADPQNWIALFAFLTTAVAASELSARAQRGQRTAVERRRELERLYAFSQLLLSSDNAAELLNAIPRHIVENFGVRSAAIALSNRADIYRSSAEINGLESQDLQVVTLRGEPRLDAERQLAFMPLRIGMRVVGSMGVAGSSLSRQTLEAIGSLVAIAVERASAFEKLSRAEAARESEQLRSVLLDSVTHEFRTPLTSIKASATPCSARELTRPKRPTNSSPSLMRRAIASIAYRRSEQVHYARRLRLRGPAMLLSHARYNARPGNGRDLDEQLPRAG